MTYEEFLSDMAEVSPALVEWAQNEMFNGRDADELREQLRRCLELVEREG
jgi:hypothetical protein